MNSEERQMITGLFDRMRQQGSVDKDRDAEALIRDTVRQLPDAPYIMVQTVLVQEMALQNAQQQIQDLEDRVLDRVAEIVPTLIVLAETADDPFDLAPPHAGGDRRAARPGQRR